MATKKTVVPLISTDDQVNEYMTALADAQLAANRAELRAKAKIADAEAELAKELSFQHGVIVRCAMILTTYFDKNYDVLTDGGKRQSCEFATGTIGQRRTPPRTKFHDEEAVKEFVVKHGMTDFYVMKIFLFRDAMLRNPELARTIPGVKIVQDRIVFAKPTDFEVVIDLKKKVEEVA